MDIPAYRIGEVIGRGGMGVVYRAEHLHLRRTVALKVLAPEIAGTEGFRERFIHEARVAAGVDHPAIVTVYDAGEANGQLYIAMRYVEGSDLATVLRSEGPLAAERALALLDQVASALDAAHAHGLVHRDVKPANVLLQGDRAYLTDFGLTKRTTSATAFTATGQFVGTVDYVAPEQIRGDELSARTDVYALACVLYECLTGARPYRRDSEIATIYAHLEEPPPRPSEHGLPLALDDVLTRAMAKDPTQRQATCGALLVEARQALEEPPTEVAAPKGAPAASTRPAAPAPPTEAAATARPGSAPTPELPPDRARRRIVPLAIGAATVGALVVAAVLVTGGSGEDDPPAGTNAQQTQPQTQAQPPGSRIVERAAVGSEPVGVAVRSGVTWVTNSGDGTVSRLDARTGERVGEPLPVGTAPNGITIGRGSVWVANVADGTVSRLDASTGRTIATIPVGSDPRWVALGVSGTSLWVSNGGDDTVSRVDIATNREVDVIEVGSQPRGIATTPSSVWVANSGDDTLSRIDVETNSVDEPVEAGSSPEGIAIKDGVLWVANTGDGTVSRLDNADGTPLGPPVQVGGQPFDVAAGDAFVWVTQAETGEVTLIDPDTGEVAGGPTPVGEAPASVRVDEGLAWVAVRGTDRAVLLESLR